MGKHLAYAVQSWQMWGTTCNKQKEANCQELHNTLKLVKNAKYLGLSISHSLSWKCNENNIQLEHLNPGQRKWREIYIYTAVIRHNTNCQYVHCTIAMLDDSSRWPKTWTILFRYTNNIIYHCGVRSQHDPTDFPEFITDFCWQIFAPIFKFIREIILFSFFPQRYMAV